MFSGNELEGAGLMFDAMQISFQKITVLAVPVHEN